MSHGVLALGTTALCLAGNVWYLPACVDLRAGQDRPRSRRAAAGAVLTGWGTAALTAVLLLTPAPLTAIAAVAVAGAVAVGCLGVLAWSRRGRERHEVEAFTAALGATRNPSPDRVRGLRRNPARRRSPADPAEGGR